MTQDEKSLVPIPEQKKKTKKQIREEAIEIWWEREPWPAIILAIDPGKKAGASIICSKPREGLYLLSCEPVDTLTYQVERTVEKAIRAHYERSLKLVLVLEQWGTGGKLGIDQWLGLGEARGAWKRTFILQCKQFEIPHKVITVTQSRWRSRVVPETGDRSSGTFQRFTPEQWKEAAHRAALDYFPGDWVPPLDAAESACIGIYAARSDELGKLLGKRELLRYNLVFKPIEDQISK